MTATTPDVIIIRGAPGAGKTRTSKCLAARLRKGVRIEVDTLRAMVIPVDWTNQAEHISILSLATGLVAGFLGLGHRPVIVVDTFSGGKLAKFLAELRARDARLDVRVLALVTDPAVLRARVENRPADEFKDIGICEKLNSHVVKHRQPGDWLINNSSLTPEETVDLILGVITAGMEARSAACKGPVCAAGHRGHPDVGLRRLPESKNVIDTSRFLGAT